jgi:tRNA-Thr(GGU) m(6)t(6)A37 methyltransferase TsaA
MKIIYKPIGIIHSPFDKLEDMPIQPSSESSSPGVVEVYPEFTPGLKDLEGFSHVYLLYHLHKTGVVKLKVTPFLDEQSRGLFATRAPSRPNPIGLSLVNMVRIETNLIHVDRVDVLDGTPLIDLKPYIPAFEEIEDVRIGWLENTRDRIHSRNSDARFKG